MMPYVRTMRLADFDFDLPEARIALRPASPRDSARLLVVGEGGALADRQVHDLPELLRPGDALVFNDTRVMPARLRGLRAPRRGRGGRRGDLAPPSRRVALERLRAGQAGGSRSATGSSSARAHDRACLLGTLEATVVEQGRGRRGDAGLRPRRRPISTQAIAAARRDAAATLHRQPPARGRARPRPTTRPSTPARTARWPRRPPGCTSRPT